MIMIALFAAAILIAYVARPRRPDFVLVTAAGDTYMRRWWVWARNRWANAYWHILGADDDARAVHDHPWWNITIVIRGSYREVFADGTFKIRRPGSIVLRSPRDAHRLEIVTPTVTTLFLTGPVVRDWGFQTATDGWMHHSKWQDYCSARGAAEGVK